MKSGTIGLFLIYYSLFILVSKVESTTNCDTEGRHCSDSLLSKNIEDDHSIWTTISRVVMAEVCLCKRQLVVSLKQYRQLWGIWLLKSGYEMSGHFTSPHSKASSWLPELTSHHPSLLITSSAMYTLKENLETLSSQPSTFNVSFLIMWHITHFQKF